MVARVRSRPKPDNSEPGFNEVTGVPIEYFDERFTTHEAELALSGMGLTKKKRKARLDKLAAQIMLTGYLERAESRRRSTVGR